MGSTDSKRDVELLGALINRDSVKFQRIIGELKREASQIALGLFDGDNIKIDEAVSQAIDKVSDWMSTDAIFNVSYPFAYAKKMVYRAVIDYDRAHKHEKAISNHKLRKELAKIDEAFGYWGESEEDAAEGTGTWYGVKVHDRGKYVKLDVSYPEHPLLMALSFDWKNWLFSDHSKTARDRRWAKYKLIMALVGNIPSLPEQQIVNHYLRGYRQTDIVKELDDDKSYISRVVNKWLRDWWGWDKLQLGRSRVILLTNYLATIYKHMKLTEEELKDLEIQAEEKFPNSFNPRWHREFLEEQKLGTKLFPKVTGAPETKAYFGDLKESDSLGLAVQCARFFNLWYYNPSW